jgi:hypothetical protein
VVIYERPSDPVRNITLFDGIDRVVGGTVAVSLTDFRVPNAGFDGKLGVVGLDGELPGAQLRFGVGRLTAANALSNAQNPANSFFNGSRSFLGQAVSVVGDLPQTTGRRREPRRRGLRRRRRDLPPHRRADHRARRGRCGYR